MPENSASDAPEEQPWTPPTEPPAGQRVARGAFSNVESDAEDESAVETAEDLTSDDLEMASQVEDEYFPGEDELQSFELEKTPIPDPGPLRDEEMGLMQHLGELRSRILKCVVVVGLATCFTWNHNKEFSSWFARPIYEVLKKNQVPGMAQNEIISIDPTEFFAIALQMSVVSALILTMPFVLYQLWAFIEPALTNQERKFGLVLTPFSVVLFFAGAGLGYLISPLFFQFFIQFQPPEVAAKWGYKESVVLLAKMLLAFGICFQVPVITIFLNKIGLVSRNWLIEYWRHAVVLIFTVVAIITPTWDPLTMTICAVPPCLLYGLSIWIIKWI